MNPIIEAEGLTVRYGQQEVLHDLSLTLGPGEIMGVLGPNGAGKTTALACMEGLLIPDAGTIRVFSLDPVTEREKVYMQMGAQLQDTKYPLRIRVRELCSLFASFYENPADWHQLLEGLGLRHVASQNADTLSGGEKQKLSILLSLMGRPKLLLLDEISTGLDPEVRRSLHESLRQIAAAGTAMITVTHYPDELQGFADRILLLERGYARFQGTPDGFRQWAGMQAEKRETPATLELAYLAVCPKQPALSPEMLT